MIVLGKPEKVLDTKGVNHMENEMLDQMHKKLVWKIIIQFIWILCITAMIVCIIYTPVRCILGQQPKSYVYIFEFP